MFVQYQDLFKYFYLAILSLCLPFVFYFDIRFKRIPNLLNLFMFSASLVVVIILQRCDILFFIVSFLISAVIVVLMKVLIKNKIGNGDLKYLLAVGIAGIDMFNLTMLASSVIALIYYGFILLRKKKRPFIAFGPFLSFT